MDEVQMSKAPTTISDDSSLLARKAAIAQMEEELRRILVSVSPVRNRLPSEPSSTYTDSEYSWYFQDWVNSNFEINTILDESTIQNLRTIAKQMIDAGYSRDLVQVYLSVRKTSMGDRFEELRGFERLSSKHIKMLKWQVQQEKIRRWTHAAKICIRGLFAGERAFTKQIFGNFGANIADDCFMKTVKDSAVKLLNFVVAISSSRKSSEKLFQILELYEVLSDLRPDIETLFRFESGEFIRKQAVEILSRLAEAAREILPEFERDVFGQISEAPIPGGSVHPLTIYVMNYIDSMMEYKQIMIQLIVSRPTTHSSILDLDFSEFEGQDAPLVLHFLWITKILKFNLKAKSKQYKDGSLAHFFMMNNVHYIVEKIRWSIELREMIGDDYLNKLTDEYSLAATNYLKTSWKRVLDCLRDDGLQKLGGCLCGTLSKFVLRHRFKAFNARFKEVLTTTHETWLVVDVQLREDLSFSLLQMLMIPVYTSFLERHRSHIESAKDLENYIKYSAVEVEKAVMNLLEDC